MESAFQHLRHLNNSGILDPSTLNQQPEKTNWRFERNQWGITQAGHYSAQSSKLSNLCFLTEYQISIGQRTIFAPRQSLEIAQGHVTAYIIIYVTKIEDQ